jgi:branched-chain amino acid transport system ATP-binding protein
MQREGENLSGGEMQMVAIARALLGAPGLVLLDEPSQGLAPKVAQDVMETIRRMKHEGLSVLLVEQHGSTSWSWAASCTRDHPSNSWTIGSSPSA